MSDVTRDSTLLGWAVCMSDVTRDSTLLGWAVCMSDVTRDSTLLGQGCSTGLKSGALAAHWLSYF